MDTIFSLTIVPHSWQSVWNLEFLRRRLHYSETVVFKNEVRFQPKTSRTITKSQVLQNKTGKTNRLNWNSHQLRLDQRTSFSAGVHVTNQAIASKVSVLVSILKKKHFRTIFKTQYFLLFITPFLKLKQVANWFHTFLFVLYSLYSLLRFLIIFSRRLLENI